MSTVSNNLTLNAQVLLPKKVSPYPQYSEQKPPQVMVPSLSSGSEINRSKAHKALRKKLSEMDRDGSEFYYQGKDRTSIPNIYGGQSHKSTKLPYLSRSSQLPNTTNTLDIPDRLAFVQQAQEIMAKASRRTSVGVPAVLNSLSPNNKIEKSRFHHLKEDTSLKNISSRQSPKNYPNQSPAFSAHPLIKNLSSHSAFRRPSKLGNPFDDEEYLKGSRRTLKPFQSPKNIFHNPFTGQNTPKSMCLPMGPMTLPPMLENFGFQSHSLLSQSPTIIVVQENEAKKARKLKRKQKLRQKIQEARSQGQYGNNSGGPNAMLGYMLQMQQNQQKNIQEMMMLGLMMKSIEENNREESSSSDDQEIRDLEQKIAMNQMSILTRVRTEPSQPAVSAMVVAGLMDRYAGLDREGYSRQHSAGVGRLKKKLKQNKQENLKNKDGRLAKKKPSKVAGGNIDKAGGIA